MYRGDWFIDTCFYIKQPELWIKTEICQTPTFRNSLTWLPTGDQLDEEIIKTCFRYEQYYIKGNMNKNTLYGFYQQMPEKFIKITANNPLIAKIKLLKELLKGKK